MPTGGPGSAETWSPIPGRVPLRDRSLAALALDPVLRASGFSRAELLRLRQYFREAGRDPTDVEVAGIAQSWSEHCSYKTSRPFLIQAFRRTRPSRVLGTGDAGVLRFGRSDAYALRIESHNHPSAVEPYGGAATGIGGILRDVLAVGARPIALADPLFFGPLDLPAAELPRGVHAPRYLFSDVVAGIRDYGNRVGVPTISGGVYFDPAYVVNPIVNVGCVGFLPRKRFLPNRARKAGDALVLVGGLTGRDGIGGVAFASQELTSASTSESRGQVQLGNPIMKEPLIRACVEVFDRGLVGGLKDLGGGGLATGAGELAYAGGLGLELELTRVPLRESGLSPWEIWISESQERMVLDVPPRHLDALLRVFERYDVPAAAIGKFTPGAYERLTYEGLTVARLRLGFRVAPPPVRRKLRRPVPARRSAPRLRDEVRATVEDLILAPDSVSREPVVRVYEQEVGGRTVVKALQGLVTTPSHGDACVLRPSNDSWMGLAVTVAAQPWACREDPRRGAKWVVEEAARNLYAVGARPDAFTNCLNFGNPEDPRILGEFAEVVRGLADGARALDMAVPSGNVSFYNGGLGHGILPTPVLMATGIVPDFRRCTTSDLKAEGDPLYLVGPTLPEVGGSLFARRRGLKGYRIPSPDPKRLRERGERLLRAGERGWIRAVHDVSDGGLAVALPEMAFGGALGFSVDVSELGLENATQALVVEGGSRWVVEVDPAHVAEFDEVFNDEEAIAFGTVARAGGRIMWKARELARLDLSALYHRWRGALGG